jgi:hypothetical protein
MNVLKIIILHSTDIQMYKIVMNKFKILCYGIFPYKQKKIEMFFFIPTENIFSTTTNAKAKQMNSTLKKPVFRQMIKQLLKQCEERIEIHVAFDYSPDQSDQIALQKVIEVNNLVKKLHQIEKLMLTNILNDGKKIIYKRLLLKYDEVLNEIYYIAGELVNMDAAQTEDYLHYCKESGEIRNMVKRICDYAERHSE